MQNHFGEFGSRAIVSRCIYSSLDQILKCLRIAFWQSRNDSQNLHSMISPRIAVDMWEQTQRYRDRIVRTGWICCADDSAHPPVV